MVVGFEFDVYVVVFDGCWCIGYCRFVVCLGFKFDWYVIDGFVDMFGCNGVMLNYCYDFVLYMWEFVCVFCGGNVFLCSC